MVINGLIFGLISTLHCAGMCGPLALNMQARAGNGRKMFLLMYQIGRIGTYILIGSLVYSIGYTFSLFRMQQVLSISIGVLMVLFVLWPLFKLPVPSFTRRMLNSANLYLSRIAGSGKGSSAFGLGVMNGLLPCGAIYLAAMYCAALSTPLQSLGYMFLFGIGTTPVFIAAWLFVSGKFAFSVRKWNKLYRLLPLLVGILMIFRGANLGIPYLSPELQTNDKGAEVKDCCKH